MATDLQPTTPTVQPKHDAFVEKQLGRTSRRIRMLDLAAAGLGLCILTLGYALAMVLLDRAVELSPLARQVAFGGYLLAVIGYLGWGVVWPLLKQVNPYYAARELERTLPEAKNSIVNWLDLRRLGLSPAMQTVLGQRAARDLTQANLDEAIDPKRVTWLGGAVLGLLLGLVILFFLGPNQFYSLLSRAFAPFNSTRVANRTQLTLLKPEGGNVTIPMGRAVAITVEVGGRIPQRGQPDALRLHYRHNHTDSWEEKLLDQGDTAHQWGTTILAAQVQNGFWYKITGGDDATPEYRVQVRSLPLLTGFEATYRYRKYLGWPDVTTPNPNLGGHRGTEVTLLARANRPIKEGQLVVESDKGEGDKLPIDKPLHAEVMAEDAHAMRFQLTLERSGTYKVWFTATDGERNLDPLPFTIQVLSDLPPTVELKKPGSDVELPANGTLRLEGAARDDFGVAQLTLHLRLADGADLKARPYRAGKGFLRDDGTYPQNLEYKDFVELDKVQSATGQVMALKPGQVLEYWLEAADGCDYPKPNVARTQTYRVTIAEPAMDQEQIKNERDAARQEQQKHEQQQDNQLNQENKDRAAGQPPKPQPQQGQPPQQEPNEQQAKKDEELQRKLDELQQQADKQRREGANQPGQAKDEPQPPEKGEPKNEGNTPMQEQPERGQEKPQGQPDQTQQPQGQGKNEGKPDQKQQTGAGKGQGEPQQGQPSAGEGQSAPQGAAKGDPQQTPRAEQKPDQGQAGAGEPKGQPKNGSGTQTAASEPKPSQGDPMGDGTPQGEPKGAGTPQTDATAQSQPEKRDPQQAARELAKQLYGDDPKQRDAAAEKLAQMQQQASRGSQSNDPKDRADAERRMQDAARAAEEFTKAAEGKDEKTKQAAADALKKAMDKAQREDQTARAGEKQKIDDLTKQMQGGGEQERAAAKDQLQKMGQNAGSPENRKAAQDALAKQEQNAGNSGVDPQTKKDIEKLAEQMRSGNEQARKEAAQKLDQIARENKDPQTRQMADEALAKNQPAGGGDPKTKEQLDKLAKDLQSGDPQKQEAARKQLREMAEKGGDPQTRQAARETLKRNDPAAQNAGQGDPKVKEKIEQLAKDLQSGDPQKRDEAQRQLDQMAKEGKDDQTRKQAQDALAKQGQGGQDAEQRAEQLRAAMEKMAKQLQNMDGKQREELLKQMQDLAKKAQDSQEKLDAAETMRRAQELTKAFEKLSPEAKRSLQDLAKQMQSQNDAQRKEAEQKLDEMRRNAQDDATRQAAEAMQKGAEQQRQQAGGTRTANGPDEGRQGGHDEPAKPGAAPNKDHAGRAGALTLQSFSEFKKKLTKEMMNEAKITEQDLKDMEDFLRRRQPERTEPEKLAGPNRGGTLPNQQLRQVQGGTPTATGAQRTGPTVSPPDIRDAQYEFNKRLSEIQKAREKQ